MQNAISDFQTYVHILDSVNLRQIQGHSNALLPIVESQILVNLIFSLQNFGETILKGAVPENCYEKLSM